MEGEDGKTVRKQEVAPCMRRVKPRFQARVEVEGFQKAKTGRYVEEEG